MPDPDFISEKAEYSRFDSDGVEQCPVCGTLLDSRWHAGAVVQPTGLTEATLHEALLETDPNDGPFYCRECWDDHCTEVYSETHRTLSEFSTENSTYYG